MYEKLNFRSNVFCRGGVKEFGGMICGDEKTNIGLGAGMVGAGMGLIIAGIGVFASSCASGCFCLGGHPEALGGFLNGVMCGGKAGCFLSACTGRIMLSGPICYMLNTVATPIGLVFAGLGLAVGGWFTLCREPTAEEIRGG